MLDDEYLAPMEVRLRWIVVIRILGTLSIPMLLALYFDSMYLKVGLWFLSAMLMFALVKGWGDAVYAIAVAIIPLYIYCELAHPPRWLAYLSAIVILFEFGYVKRRIKQIAQMRESARFDDGS